MKRIFYILTFIFFGLFGVVNEVWSEAAIISFGTPNVKINSTSIEGDDNIGNTWYITTIGTTSFTQQPTYSQVGSKDKPATSITFTTTLASSHTITSFTAKFGGFSGTEGNITLKVGNITVGTGSLNATNDVTVSNSSNAIGTVLTVTVTGIAKGVKCYYISYSYNSSPTPTTYDTITFRDIHNNKWTLKTTENNDTIFLHDTVPSEACRLNGWVFAGWSTDSLDETKIIKDSSYIIPTKNDTLYAFYKTKTNEAELYIVDTITYDKIGLGYLEGGSYTDFNDIICSSNAYYSGQIYRFSKKSTDSYIQMRSSGSNSGIVSTNSGGQLDSIWVVWNSATASDRTLNVYESNEAFESASELYGTSLPYKSVIYGTSNGTKLTGKKYIGIRSASNALYLDTIFIKWFTNGLGYEYSTNPQCFETNISVAEWHEDYVEFDIGNYDSVHTYNIGEMNSCDSIRIKITHDGKDCIRWFQVPIFAGKNTSKDDCNCDVVVLHDSTFTVSNNMSNSNVYVYGTLIIDKNKTYTVNSLTLRRDNDSVPQLLYNGTLAIENGLFFELRTDGSDWRWLTLPDTFRTSLVNEPEEVVVKYYDGAIRAKNGRGGWKEEWDGTKNYTKKFATGEGCIFGITKPEKRIYKLKLDTSILKQEKAHKYVRIHPYYHSDKPKNDLGWNLVGNPFMTTDTVSTNFGVAFKADYLVREFDEYGNWTGRWDTIENAPKLRYIVIPSDSDDPEIVAAGGYEQICLENGYKLKPFTSFFIQAKQGSDTLTFYHGSRIAASKKSSKKTVNKESFLQIQVGSIKSGCYISDKFSDDYEMGDDMESLYSTHQLINGYKLLYSAINDSILERGIQVYGSGNVSLNEKTDINSFIEINALCDGVWYDLLRGDSFNANGEFTLYGRRLSSEVATGVETIGKIVSVKKFMSNGILYIIMENKVYNAIGEPVK